MDESSDPAAVFACAMSLHDACVEYAGTHPSVNISASYTGRDEFLRQIMRVGNLFETWACSHVDFEMLTDVAKRNGAEVMGVQMQGEWLRQMGIDIRHEALLQKNPGEKDKLMRQYHRLVDDGQMGTLFKVMGVCGRRWPIGVGFD